MVVARPLLFLLIAAVANGQVPERLQIVWPTPNAAYAANRPPEDYVQPTVSGRVESGLFGCVRNSGTRYHEAVDLKPTARNSRGEATDPIYAVMDGAVAYVSRVPGHSSYGRYLVIEHGHVRPAIITLYAHLSAVDAAITEGVAVKAGQTIATMGRSAGGYTIPKERAHLHFEMGFYVTENFQSWYDWKKYTTPNRHGVFNGMNMIGFDPIDFYDQFRAGRVSGFQEYLDQLPVAFTVRVKSREMPDFIRRYPTLLEGGIPARGIGGWEIDFTSFGLPARWRALAASDPAVEQRERARVISHDARIVAQHSCRNAIAVRRGGPSIASHTERTLQLIFGFR